MVEQQKNTIGSLSNHLPCGSFFFVYYVSFVRSFFFPMRTIQCINQSIWGVPRNDEQNSYEKEARRYWKEEK